MFGIKRDEFTPDTPNTHHFDHFLMQMQQSFGSNNKKKAVWLSVHPRRGSLRAFSAVWSVSERLTMDEDEDRP